MQCSAAPKGALALLHYTDLPATMQQCNGNELDRIERQYLYQRLDVEYE